MDVIKQQINNMSSKFGLKSYLQFPLSSIIVIYQMGAIECFTYLLTNHYVLYNPLSLNDFHCSQAVLVP